MKTGRETANRKPQILNLKKRSALLCLLIFSVCGLSFEVASAADLQVSAALDRNQIALNEQAVLNLTISGSGDLPSPQLPALPDFQIYNAGKQQNFSWINGQASASVTYQYVLTALKTGHFTIPAILVQSNGQSAQTQALDLDVVRGDASAIASPRQPADDGGGQAAPAPTRSSAVFITGTVTKSSVYVGEPVVFSFRLYNRVPLTSRPSYEPPETPGFWSEDLPPQRNYTTTVKGVPYNVTEVQTALFPTSAGQAKIGAASLSVSIENFGSDPFSNNFFAQFFGQGEQKVLRTEPIAIHVKSLPDPKPEGFKGAVGHYTISSAMDKDTTSVGQPLTLTVTVAGAGNIKSLPDITLPALTNFRTFSTNAAANIEKKDGQVQGSKVFKTLLIPTASGSLQIPSIPFVFFDPATHAYRSIATRAFSVHVTPAVGGTTTPGMSMPSATDANAPAPGIHLLGEDIRYIQTPSTVTPTGTPLYRSRLFLGFHLLILAGLLGGAVVRIYQRLFLSDENLQRFRSARAQAEERRGQAETAMDRQQGRDAAALLSDSLHGYLANKLSMDPAGIALRQVMDELRARNIPSHSIEKVRNLWETIDLYQFAPAQVRVEELRQASRTVGHIVEELEKQIAWKE